MRFRDIEKQFLKSGFERIRKSGSHTIFKHPNSNTVVPIPCHSGEFKQYEAINFLKQMEKAIDKS